MKYYRISKKTGGKTEISYKEAYEYIALNSKGTQEFVEKILEKPGRVKCMFSIIEIVKEA